MQWRPFPPKEGVLNQVYIGGHPPIPIGSKHSSGNLLFLAFFRFLNYWGYFEGLNEVFLRLSTSMISPKMNFLVDTFPTSYCAPQTQIVCQIYALGKLIHQTTQNGVHKLVGFSSSGVRVLDFIYVKRGLWILIVTIIFLRM
jgi:hypothetical protein